MVQIPTPYPTAIFIREKAIVVNLSSIRMIIDAEAVLVLAVPDTVNWKNSVPATPDAPFVRDLAHRVSDSSPAVPNGGSESALHVDRTLPFELRALEAALVACIRFLEWAAADVEQQVAPSLDRLAHKISKGDLEVVRQAKARLDGQLARVAGVKEELEDLLDDDHDMRNMYLGR
eukprot:jgi/Astpho2/4040/Aster-01197